MIYFSDFGTVAAQAYTTRVPLNTSTGIQEITIAGLGFTPKLAVFSVVRATADGTPLGGVAGCFGMASGATEQGVAAFKGDTVDRIGSTSACVMLPQTGASTILAQATFDSFVPNGCRINITTAPASGYFLVVRFFGGAGVVAAKVGKIDLPNASTTTASPGIRSDLILFANNGHTLDGAWKGGAGALDYGFATYDGTTIRQCSGYGAITSPGGTFGAIAQVRSGSITSSEYLNNVTSVSSITSTGFNVTTTKNFTHVDVIYASLQLATPANAWCGVIQTTTTIGNQDLSGPSFTPTSLMMMPTTVTALNTAQTDRRGGGFGVSFIDGAQYCNGWNARDNVLFSSSGAHQSVSDDRAVNIYTHDGGTIGARASLTSFSSGKATLNFTHSNEANYWPCLFTNGI